MDFRVTMNDCRKAGHCPRGVLRWFSAHNLDFRAFMKGGIPAKEMWDTGDGQGQQVVRRAAESKGIEIDG